MRLAVGFILILVGIICVQSSLVARQATDTLADLDAILATAPELASLIILVKDGLIQLSSSLPSAQFQSLQQQAIQLVSSLATGNIDVNQFQERLQALVQSYLTPNRRDQGDIDQLIQQVITTDTAALPNVIINLLSER